MNVPWAKAVNPDGTLKSPAELKTLYAAAGIDGSKPIITSCRIGERSSHSWFVLSRVLGYPVRNYDGSWTEYGNAVGVPVVNLAGTVWAASERTRRGAVPAAPPTPCIGLAHGPGTRSTSRASGHRPRPRRRGPVAVRRARGQPARPVPHLRGAVRRRPAAQPLLLLLPVAGFPRRRRPRGLLGILAALAAGLAGYAVVLGAWMPDPGGTRLPPDAHIGPVGPVLLLAGAVFGAGMAISGSCISAHLYRLGEGSPTAPFALVGTGLGFVLGFATWNPLYLVSVADAPVIWLPRHLGYAGYLGLALAVLAFLAWPLMKRLPDPVAPNLCRGSDPLRALFSGRWPVWLGGLAVGAIGTLAYLRVGPLGVTAEIGGRARQAAGAAGLLPARLEGLDTFRGCATAIREAC